MVAQTVVFAALAVLDLGSTTKHLHGEYHLLAELDAAVMGCVVGTLLAACRDAPTLFYDRFYFRKCVILCLFGQIL